VAEAKSSGDGGGQRGHLSGRLRPGTGGFSPLGWRQRDGTSGVAASQGRPPPKSATLLTKLIAKRPARVRVRYGRKAETMGAGMREISQVPRARRASASDPEAARAILPNVPPFQEQMHLPRNQPRPQPTACRAVGARRPRFQRGLMFHAPQLKATTGIPLNPRP
jgi:hypothetical protein